MTSADLLGLAKAHPDLVAALFGMLAPAVQTDPTLIPDVVTAVETKNYLGVALKHLPLILELAALIRGNAAAMTAISQLAP